MQSIINTRMTSLTRRIFVSVGVFGSRGMSQSLVVFAVMLMSNDCLVCFIKIWLMVKLKRILHYKFQMKSVGSMKVIYFGIRSREQDG